MSTKLIIQETITSREFNRLAADFKREIIRNGLDKPIISSLAELKTELKFIINNEIRITPDSEATAIVNTKNGLGQTAINPPKSDSEILKYLTKGKTDLTKYNKAKDFSTLSETGVVFGQRSRGQDVANRVALRMEIGQTDSVEDQYFKARQFFQNAVFALPDSNGNIKYYANPGLDITQFVKIKCSTQTGAGDVEPEVGMSPSRRFQKDKSTKGYADWTLKQDGINFVRSNFIDLTPSMDFIKDGDFNRATALLDVADKNNKLSDIKTQIVDIENTAILPQDMKNYAGTIELINSIQLSKKIDAESTLYSLVYSSSAGTEATDENSLKAILNSVRAWIVKEEGSWFKALVDKVTKLIKEFMRD